MACEFMDKTSALSRLTFCCECKLWKPTADKKIQSEYRNQIGVCNRPYEHMVTRWYDDFCSSGRPNDKVYVPDKEEIIHG